MLRFDLHIHSVYSFDSLSSPYSIAEKALKSGLDGIAITDHNELSIDFEALRKEFPELIIISGTEVGTRGVGDVLCYFISEPIFSREPEEVIAHVHAQGGLAFLAHPYQHGRSDENYPVEILEKFDGIETANSRNYRHIREALMLANKLSCPVIGGSDAHSIQEIGNGYTVLDISREEASDTDKLKIAFLNAAAAECRPAPWYAFYMSQAVRYFRKLKVIEKK